jgi:hypothetical protein
LLKIRGIKAAAKISCPLANNHANNTSEKPPAIPPNKNTAIGVPIRGATTEMINPVTMAVTKLNSNFLNINPTMIPMAILTNANGMLVGSTNIPNKRFVTRPTKAPHTGPNKTATMIVPNVSRNSNGIFNSCTTIPKTILIATPIAANTTIFELNFSITSLLLFHMFKF